MCSGRLQVPAPQVSDIPHSSASGSPIAWKNSITSRGVGAAPTLSASIWSSPRPARIFENTCSSSFSNSSRRSSGTSSPDCSSRTFFSPTSSACLANFLRSSSCSASMPASIDALSFSKIRGTAKNQLGLTSGRYEITWRASGQHVTVKPNMIGR